MSAKDLAQLVPVFDGSNWTAWEPMIKALLQVQGLAGYIDGSLLRRPQPIPLPVPAIPAGATEQQEIAHNANVTQINIANAAADTAWTTEVAAWDLADAKARGTITLKLAASLHYMLVGSARDTFMGLEGDYSRQGAAGLYVDYKKLIRWKMTNGEPAPQINVLRTLIDKIAPQIPLPELLKAMMLLDALPSSWDSVAATMLSTLN